MNTPPRQPSRIVIIGGGYGGAYCAQELERRLGPAAAEIRLIDRHNYFVIYPLLVEAGTGSVEPRHAVVSIRSFLKRSNFRMADVTGLDKNTGAVLCRDPDSGEMTSVAYDQLVIALGSVTLLPPVPGLKEFGLQMKSPADAVWLRDRAIGMLELADATTDPVRRRELLGFVVVGANFTGAEVAGELEAFLRAAVKRYRNLTRQDVNVTLIDRGDRILTALDLSLSRYAQANLEQRGIRVLLHETVSRIDIRSATLASGEILPTQSVIWAAGIAPPPVLAALGLPVDQRGYLICERDLRVKGETHIWGIGDCAVNEDAQGRAYPATAQHAIKEGVAAARNIARVLRGEAALPCDIRSEGSLAALGCRTGVANVFGIKISGFWAWWLWRTVYLVKMPGLGRKLRIALDWTLELLFPRDYVQLGIHRPQHAATPGRPADE